MNKKTTLVILLDSFRHDYFNPDDTPYMFSLRNEGIWVKKLKNTGGYCERSVFMTGAMPETTDNYFAMALMPVGYERPAWEPKFNVPPRIRDRLCMSEDQKPDFEYRSFYNWTTKKWIASIWDMMTIEGKKFAIEACVALGIRSFKGKTTHGTRPIQLVDRFSEGKDLYYIQFSEIDQQLHYLGTLPDNRRGLLRNVDAKVKWLIEQAKNHFVEVNILIFGDHGMDEVSGKIDLPLEYPPYNEGWDYMYLKSSAMIQFWIFNPEVRKYIENDILLKKYGEFVPSPTPRQGDLVWRVNNTILISPDHFHPKSDPIKAMHGWNPNFDAQKGFALIIDGKHKGNIKECILNDICPTICDLVDIKKPKYNVGKSLIKEVSKNV